MTTITFDSEQLVTDLEARYFFSISKEGNQKCSLVFI
jgi:hypothetical protein